MSPSFHSQATTTVAKPSHNPANLTPSSTNPLKRSRTPLTDSDDAQRHPASSNAGDKDEGPGERRRRTLMSDLFARSDRILSGFFVDPAAWRKAQQAALQSRSDDVACSGTNDDKTAAPQPKRKAVDEDDYGDDEDEEGLVEEPVKAPPLARTTTASSSNTLNGSQSRKPDKASTASSTTGDPRSSEDAGKELEQEMKADEDAARSNFQEMFYTVENDHDAMVEQSKLDELDRQVEADTAGDKEGADISNESAPVAQQGTLSSANLGATSLTLRHLIAKIDSNRNQVSATDDQLRKLLSEVRKNRSKWASEERVGQEELYEPAEHVLNELKGMTEYSTPFLKAVSMRDAPDYKKLIHKPMDIGTMLRRLKNIDYKSKKEFVDDLELIWSNCLKYNSAPEHPIRRKAEHMRKETARLTTLIPDIVIRSRAEVEAEERRLHPEFDDAEESEDEPLMSTRGRKAPAKASKGSSATTTSRKAPPTANEGDSTPGPEKPSGHTINALANFKKEHLRSEMGSVDGSQRGGTQTPPAGDATPLAGDSSEMDGVEPSVLGTSATQEEDPDDQDEEYRTWKQVTKKDRARVAQERHRLFNGNKLNLEEPALLRSKAAMTRFLRYRGANVDDNVSEERPEQPPAEPSKQAQSSTTLAEGMAVVDNEDSTLPDYYSPLTSMPAVNKRLDWTEDADGQVIDLKAECLRALPANTFHAPVSKLTTKMDAHIRQVQETRKVVQKISVVKQMQVQTQTYQNQFQKHDVVPIKEPDIEPIVVSDDGPVMSPELCRASLQRCVGKIFFHAGFEDFQPSALDVVTDLTSNYLTELVNTLGIYRETAKVPVSTTVPQSAGSKVELKPRFTDEEAILHTLNAFSHDVDGLDSYVTDDMSRLTSRLELHHTRTRDYLTDLLRPAFVREDTRGEGINFSDANENFVGGNFAEDIDEDYFGFRELGLDREFGIPGLSVPLHLLQSRIHDHFQPHGPAVTTGQDQLMAEPARYEAITSDTVELQVGIVKEFFRKRLEDNDDEPLVEDDDLPVKQRYPKPRLPPTGKISSPRKRPIREQQQMARKKRRLEIEEQKQRERERENGVTPAPTANGAGDGNTTASTTNTTTTNGKEGGDAGAKKDSDTPMVNGITSPSQKKKDQASNQADLDALFDDPEPEPEADKPLTPKSMQRVKLDAPSQQTKEAKSGDPMKRPATKQQPNGVKSTGDADGDGDAEGEDGDGDGDGDEEEETGIMRPGKLPIAAH